MTTGNQRAEANQEPVTITDKRRVDPETGEARQVPPGAEPGGAEPGGAEPGGAEPAPAGAQPDQTAAQADGKVAELTADLQRVQADFANYRKRALRDQQAAADRAKAAVINQLLGVLDDLERARKHGDLESGPLKSVADKLDGALTGLGLTAFGAEGEDFDPVLHEAVQHDGDGGPGSRTVIGTVMRQGYKLGENVLRHALVGVVDTFGDTTAGDAAETGSEAEPAATGDNTDTTAE